MKKNLILLLSVIILNALATIEVFATLYARYISPLFVQTIGRLVGLFPISLFEWVILFLIIGLLLIIVRYRSWTLVFRYLLVICLVFTLTTGINYHRQPIEKDLQFTKVNYTTKELKQLCQYVTNQLYILDTTAMDQAAMAKQSRIAMNQVISGYYPNPKPMLFSKLMTACGLSGIFSPFTIEANYNKDMTAFNMPFTMCHELSHLQGYMSEDEANFLAYLACTQSDQEYFRYSAYLTAFIYMTNELYDLGVDIDPYYAQLSEPILKDLKEDHAFWNQYGDTMSSITNTVNDTYLKMNSVEEGVVSYQRFVGLIFSYYKQNNASIFS